MQADADGRHAGKDGVDKDGSHWIANSQLQHISAFGALQTQ